ncbi:MAG: carboxypeptidase regulatory-like domain-containing protein, partial [Acidobacteriota bacterium]
MKPKLLGKYLSVPVLFALLTVFLAPPAFAQVGGGGITGTVTDVTGGIMPGVEVTLRNEETNVVRRAVTNDNGSYRITNLPPGMYTIRFELEGFKRLESSGNEITVGEIVSLDATLEVGDITETLTVTSLSAVVNTEDSQPSTLIGEEQIVDLPLNGRNAYALALVAPGVVPAMGSVAQTSGAAGSSFMAAGTRARGNNFTLDGAHNTNDGISGLPVVQPSVDSVQEFRLIRNNFSAEYGTHSGSVVNVVTKSGTNSIHGTAYEFHRNDAFDAADTFAYYDETTGEKDKSPLKQNQFGFTLGGPIIKDKVFFFGGYEGFRQRTGSTAVTNVETPEFRQYLQQNYAGNVSTETLNQFPALAPTSGIMTVQDLIDTGSFLCWHCDPSQWPADLPVLGRVNTSGSDSNDSDQFHIRMDVNFTENTQLFGRFDYNDGAATYKFFARPGMGEFSEGEQRGLTLALTHAFTPTTRNEFRFSYLYGRSDFLAEQPQVPDVAMTGIAGISGTIGGFLGYPQLFTRDTFQFQDIVSFNVGDHFFRAGVDLRKAAEDSDFGNQS